MQNAPLLARILQMQRANRLYGFLVSEAYRRNAHRQKPEFVVTFDPKTGTIERYMPDKE